MNENEAKQMECQVLLLGKKPKLMLMQVEAKEEDYLIRIKRQDGYYKRY
jgi:hypothetical protein